MTNIRLSKQDIARVDDEMRFYEPYMRADGKWIFPKEYPYHVIHLRHLLNVETDKAYNVVTPEFCMTGYLHKDGLTITEY